MDQGHRTVAALSSRPLRWLVLALCLLLAGCHHAPDTQHATGSGAAGNSAPLDGQALFKDEAAPAGLNFRHDAGLSGHFYMIEQTAPGCAFIDFNNDDYPDIFLVQTGQLLPTGKPRPHCALFRNNRNGTFSDVTTGSGLDKDFGYGQGVAVGDYDNDGFDDLLITSYGGLHLLHNEHGSGRFTDVTRQMGLAQARPRYATSAAFGDYDNDGRLDLYVCAYAEWTPATNKECRESGVLDYCSPWQYDPEADHLYHNTGHGFADVSAQAGINRVKGRALAVAFLDYDGDGRQDIYVANDLSRNTLWHNNGDGTFTDKAVAAGCAYGDRGEAMAGMGIAAADYDHSGHESLYVTNFSSRPNVLFRNLGGGFYMDATGPGGLLFSHLKLLSFGCEFFDYDADGWSDLITNNGHVETHAQRRPADVPLEQPKQLLHNERNGRFREVSDPAELGDLKQPAIGRGLAVGDYDNDGHLDVLCANQNGPPQLLHNQTHNGNHWVSFKTIGTKSNRDGIHTRFELQAGGARQTATVQSGSSYLSSSDRRVYFGLGRVTKIDQVVAQWPSGTREVFKNLDVDTFYTLTQGHSVTSHHKAGH